MLKKVWCLNSLFLLSLAVAVGGAACGDDDGSADGSDDDDDGDDGGTEADAGPGNPDAGPGSPDGATPDAAIPDAAPPVTARIWVHGDVATNNRLQMASYDLGTPIPATPSVVLPPGDTGTLAAFSSFDSGAYDITVDGRTLTLPADVEMVGRFDLYVASTDGTNLRRAFQAPENAPRRQGTLLARRRADRLHRRSRGPRPVRRLRDRHRRGRRHAGADQPGRRDRRRRRHRLDRRLRQRSHHRRLHPGGSTSSS